MQARIQLAALSPEDLAVELYVGHLNPAGDIVNAVSVPMKARERDRQDMFLFEAVTPCTRSGRHGFTVRVRPYHPDLVAPFLPNLLCWADGAAC